MKLLLFLMLLLSGTPAIAARDCASVKPSDIRLAFETYPYAKSNKLVTELPIIEKQADGTCRTILHTHEVGSGGPAGTLVLQLLVVYYMCTEGPESIMVMADTPGACPWLRLEGYPGS